VTAAHKLHVFSVDPNFDEAMSDVDWDAAR